MADDTTVKESETIDLGIKNILIIFFLFILFYYGTRWAANSFPNKLAGLNA